jgi:hypothetical protein
MERLTEESKEIDHESLDITFCPTWRGDFSFRHGARWRGWRVFTLDQLDSLDVIESYESRWIVLRSARWWRFEFPTGWILLQGA